MRKQPSLKMRALRRMCLTLFGLAAMLFLSAGSLRFWQASVFLVLQAAFWTYFFLDFLKNDPQLLERRLKSKETEPEQKLFQRLFALILNSAVILAGLDFRFGWTRRWVGDVPVAVVIAGQTMAVAGYWLVFWVMKTNTFASSIIQVENQRTVIRSGPYEVVRHPMYTGMVVTVIGIPLALGSYVTLPVFALLVPLLAYRLIHEERMLRRDLSGYAEYCEHTRFRLVPRVW
ncbi:MAG TPA: isoprenylcysteine carboxylmethyltransferase family protein [Candidatus Acidoferrum sp.]|nr:isoprenylcysteine carboxylmethyltransferase family protein [Candidatus Acidoferrum sp.]